VNRGRPPSKEELLKKRATAKSNLRRGFALLRALRRAGTAGVTVPGYDFDIVPGYNRVEATALPSNFWPPATT